MLQFSAPVYYVLFITAFSSQFFFCLRFFRYKFLSYDPYGPARNSILENHKEKVPYEGRTRRSESPLRKTAGKHVDVLRSGPT